MSNKQPKKIGIMGSHSAGKSTLSFDIACRLKKLGLNVGVVQETVRYSPFPYNDKMQPETALWAYHAQICKELEYSTRGFDYIISDRTAADTFIYAKYFDLFKSEPRLESCKRMAINWLSTYDNIIFIRSNSNIVADGMRSTDQYFRDQVDSLFEDFVNLEYQNKAGNINSINTTDLIKKGIPHEWITI